MSTDHTDHASGLMSFADARARVLEGVPPLGLERVGLERAVGRVLAQDVRASAPRPSFDASTMDGYALAADELPPGERFVLQVEGESRAGGPSPTALAPGRTCRIFTGAPLPPGADTVVMQEQVQREGDSAVFTRRPAHGECVRRAGCDLEIGALALARGTRLGPAQIALLASLDLPRVSVTRRPVVAIVSTGDELREPGAPDRPGSVVDSNGPALAAAVAACGGIARVLPFAPDDLVATRDAIASALAGADVLLTVGGVSVGEHDVVRPALAAAGVAVDFWRVAIKPGKPLVVGRAGARRYLGLPGNPASAMLTFALFGAPLLRTLQGDAAPLPPVFPARLTRATRHATGRLEFARVRLGVDTDGWVAELLPNQASGAVTSLAWANGIAMLAPDVADFPAGAMVPVFQVADV